MSAVELRAEFFGVVRRKLFLLLYSPTGDIARCVMLIPPFAEEMNKSRRMMSLLAHALAQRGIAAIVPDLFGTGDSEGEFVQATWDEWVTNIRMVRSWCEESGLRVDGFVGIRLGCALGLHALCREAGWTEDAVLWQPVMDGSRALDQFLRLRVAAMNMRTGGRETVKSLKERLVGGETMEIAGYQLAPTLAAQLDGVRAPGPILNLPRAKWIEVAPNVGSAISVASAKVLGDLQSRGCNVDYRQVAGEPFWSTTEITTIPALVEYTVDALYRST